MSAGGSASQGSSSSMTDSFSQALGQSFNNASSFGTSGGQSGTFVDRGQGAFQNRLNRRGENMLGQGQGAVTRASNFASQNNRMAQRANTALFNPQNQIDAQTASLSAGLGNLFENEINPAIEGNAIGAGGFGGGRHGVAQGVATGQLGEAFTAGIGDITARANAQSQQAIAQSGQLGQLGLGFAGAPSQFGFDQLSQFSDILGPANILSQSQNFGRQGSRSTGRSINRAASASKSRSSSEQESASFDFGWA